MADSNAQLDKAEKLQDLLLDSFLELFQGKGETAADRANLIKLLSSNGWSLDPSRLPQTLKDKLQLPPPELDEDDQIVGTIAKAS
jgi:hypothetical protein